MPTEINPAMVAGFKKAFGAKRPKTDALDACVIAERVRFGHLTPCSREAIVTGTFKPTHPSVFTPRGDGDGRTEPSLKSPLP
ncbi:MAG: transposase [Eubacteriales bacterium]|nr:transposase [Eubacteriales bacterium]